MSPPLSRAAQQDLSHQSTSKPNGFGSWVAELDRERLPAGCLEQFVGESKKTTGALALVWYASRPAAPDLVVEVISLQEARTLWSRTHDNQADLCQVITWTSSRDAGYLVVDGQALTVEAYSFRHGSIAKTALGGRFVGAIPSTGHGRRLIIDAGESTSILEFDVVRFEQRSFAEGAAGRVPVTTIDPRASASEWFLGFDDQPSAESGGASAPAQVDAVRVSLLPATRAPNANVARTATLFGLTTWERAALRGGNASALLDSNRLRLCFWDATANGGAGAVTLRSWSLDSDPTMITGPQYLTFFHSAFPQEISGFALSSTPRPCVAHYSRTIGGLGAKYFCAATAGDETAGADAGFVLSLSNEDATWLVFLAVGPEAPTVGWSRSYFESNVGATSSDDVRDGRLTLGIAPSTASHSSSRSGVVVLDVKTGETAIELRRSQW